MFHFSKTFDVVDHSIILVKLQMLGIGGKLLLWICEFLSGCSMSVKVAGKMCSRKEGTSGIPQCWVLFCF